MSKESEKIDMLTIELEEFKRINAILGLENHTLKKRNIELEEELEQIKGELKCKRKS